LICGIAGARGDGNHKLQKKRGIQKKDCIPTLGDSLKGEGLSKLAIVLNSKKTRLANTQVLGKEAPKKERKESTRTCFEEERGAAGCSLS